MNGNRVKVGSVTQRRRKDGTSRFGVRYWVRGEAEPRWELQPLGTSRRAAEKRLQELSGAAERGEMAMQRGVLFETYARRWLSEQKALAAAGSLKPSTYADYANSVEKHLIPFFEGLRLDEMTRADCRSFVTAKVGEGKLKPKTINNALVPLRLVLNQAGEDGCTAHAPENGIRRVKVVSKPAEWYEIDEAHLLVSRTPKEWRAAIGLAVYAGLRQGEILALRWSDVDWANNRIAIRRNLQRAGKAKIAGVTDLFSAPKSDAGQRLVPLRPVLRSLLEQHRSGWHSNSGDLLFAAENGAPVDANNFVNRVYLPSVKRAGLRKIRFHDLRHSFVTYCAAAGVPLAKVGDWVGHSDSRVTEIYRHASVDSEQFALARLDAFDRQDSESEDSPGAPMNVSRSL